MSMSFRLCGPVHDPVHLLWQCCRLEAEMLPCVWTTTSRKAIYNTARSSSVACRDKRPRCFDGIPFFYWSERPNGENTRFIKVFFNQQLPVRNGKVTSENTKSNFVRKPAVTDGFTQTVKYVGARVQIAPNPSHRWIRRKFQGHQLASLDINPEATGRSRGALVQWSR